MLALGSLLGLWGCPSENPLLVEPPRFLDSIVVALISVVPDGQGRQVVVGDTTLWLEPGKRTAAFLVQRDSLPLRILREGGGEVRVWLRLFRRMFHLLVLTSLEGRDTLGVFLQPLGVLQQGGSVRLLHGADVEAVYALQVGCPSSVPMTGWVGRLSESAPLALPAASEVVLSVLEHNTGVQRSLGTWRFAYQAGRTYSLLLWGSQRGVRVGVLEDTHWQEQQLRELAPLENAVASVRLLNLTTEPLTASHYPGGELLAEALPVLRCGRYGVVQTCSAVGMDTFRVRTLSGRELVLQGSLEPFRRYTLVVVDSGGALRAQLVESSVGTVSGVARVRFLHAAPGVPMVRVVVAGMGQGSLSSGQVVAENLAFGQVTAPVELAAGTIPLVVQETELPMSVQAAALAELPSGGSGLLCLIPGTDGHSAVVVAWVEDATDGGSVDMVPEGVPLQLLQGVPNQAPVVTLAPVLRAVPLRYRTEVATVIPRQGAVLEVDGQQWQIAPAADSLPLLVLAGDGQQRVLFHFATPRQWQGGWVAQRRFINASDVPSVEVVIDTIVAGQRKEQVLWSVLVRGQATPFELIPLEYRLSFRIRDKESGAVLARVDNVLFPLGRRYSVIFVGNRAEGYGVVVHQEL
jgi:hypothetical protein